MSKYWWGEPAIDICPQCGKHPPVIDRQYGVLPCRSCQENRGKKKSGKSIQSILEHLATPFWKIAGLKPKKEEIEQEKYMKWKGLTYLDMQKMRNSGGTFSSPLKKLL